MDTLNIELSIIQDEYKLNMLSLEHNIFYNNIDNNTILNESIILEDFKEKFENMIKKVREGIKKIIEKIKDFMSNSIHKTLESFFKRAYKELKDIPTDVEFKSMRDDGKFLDFLFLEKEYTKIRKLNDTISSCSKIISRINFDKPDQVRKKIDNIKEEYERNKDKFEDLGNKEEENYVTINGNYIRKNYQKIYTVGVEIAMSAVFKESLTTLTQADAKLGSLGQRYTSFTPSGDSKGEYHDKSSSPETINLFNQYINLYFTLCKDAFKCTKFVISYTSEINSVVTKLIKYLDKKKQKAFAKQGYNGDDYNDDESFYFDSSDFDDLEDEDVRLEDEDVRLEDEDE